MATPNEALIDRFYSAFGARDGATMAACYTPDATFSDPVFQGLTGDEPGAMWRMLTERADDLRIELLEREADDQRGSAHWLAHYTYSQTGRPVKNDVHASFRFRDGLIAEHVDDFDLYCLAAPGARARRARCSAGRRSCAGPCAGARAARSTSSSRRADQCCW